MWLCGVELESEITCPEGIAKFFSCTPIVLSNDWGWSSTSDNPHCRMFRLAC